MRIIAPMIILIMMTSTLAGCTGGDPDGGGNDEIDMDVLNSLIDDNLQDFINNTTITVENHYHNNTTIVNDNTDNSVSNINGSGVVSDSVLNMFTVEWDWRDYLQTPFPGEKIITLGGTDSNNTSNGGDSTLLQAYAYNGQIIEFRLNCDEFWHYSQYYDRDDWEDWLVINYGYNSQDMYEVSYDIRDWFQYSWYGNGIDAQDQCQWDGETMEYIYDTILYEINLEYGQAISILKSPAHLVTDVNCDDGFGTGIGNGTSLSYIGGQANCTVTGSAPTMLVQSGRVNSGITDDLGNSFWVHVPRLYTSSSYYPAVVPSFAVYFNLNTVDVYPIGE
jgi:hypothetical protein